MKILKNLVLLAALLFSGLTAHAQHTVGVVAGYGFASGRFDPKQESRAIWGVYNAGVSWRYYGTQRFVGGFGIDLEFVQQGYSFAPGASLIEDKSDLKYYSRRINSFVLPIVWQPHAYLFNRRMRLYMEAAATFFYNMSSTYENEVAREAGAENWEGKYNFKLVRDNRWGYGLAGGGGMAFLIRQFELNFRVRYYFGLSDILRNRNRYADNVTDGVENPFTATPTRSPLDNLSISVGLSYRFNKEGFNSWKVKPPRREKNKEEFNFKGVTNKDK